jgi:hypothetical protein
MCQISREMRGFIASDGKCECWGNASYVPPEELKHLTTEREIKRPDKPGKPKQALQICVLLIPKASSQNTSKFLPPARKPKTFSQRRNEMKMRAKRREMEKEAQRWSLQRKALAAQEFQLPTMPNQNETYAANTYRPMIAESQPPSMYRDALNDQELRWPAPRHRLSGLPSYCDTQISDTQLHHQHVPATATAHHGATDMSQALRRAFPLITMSNGWKQDSERSVS